MNLFDEFAEDLFGQRRVTLVVSHRPPRAGDPASRILTRPKSGVAPFVRHCLPLVCRATGAAPFFRWAPLWETASQFESKWDLAR